MNDETSTDLLTFAYTEHTPRGMYCACGHELNSARGWAEHVMEAAG